MTTTDEVLEFLARRATKARAKRREIERFYRKRVTEANAAAAKARAALDSLGETYRAERDTARKEAAAARADLRALETAALADRDAHAAMLTEALRERDAREAAATEVRASMLEADRDAHAAILEDVKRELGEALTASETHRRVAEAYRSSLDEARAEVAIFARKLGEAERALAAANESDTVEITAERTRADRAETQLEEARRSLAVLRPLVREVAYFWRLGAHSVPGDLLARVRDAAGVLS